MSAFPVHCNVAHAKQTRNVLYRQIHNDSSDNLFKKKKNHQLYSILLNHKNNTHTHIMQDFVNEHHKKYFRQFSDFILNENTKLSFAKPHFAQTISLDGIPHKVIKDREMLEKLQTDLNVEASQRTFPASINSSRSSIDSFDSGISSSIAKLTRNLPIATNNS